LQATFWSADASNSALAQRLAYSTSKSNALVAALLVKGLLDEVGPAGILWRLPAAPFD